MSRFLVDVAMLCPDQPLVKITMDVKTVLLEKLRDLKTSENVLYYYCTIVNASVCWDRDNLQIHEWTLE